MAEKENKVGKRIVEAARRLLGLRYSENGDGSQKTGIRIGGVSQVTFDRVGIRIWEDEAKKTDPSHQFVYCVSKGKGRAFEDEVGLIEGDLIYFKNSNPDVTETEGDSHVDSVGIYIGEGKMIAVSKDNGVLECDIDYFGSFRKVFVRMGNPDFELNDSSKPLPVDRMQLKKNYNQQQPSDSGVSARRVRDIVTLKLMPSRGVFCEPIYPDYITVSDTVPAWVLHASMNKKNSEAAGEANKS